ncbi:MAG TPA: AAA+ family ATPase [Cyanobacteria bacterium UBA8156]|jgi:predicted AAA+ superfamily ATPase|nr:AAA+ family ATPase [Cyanobacteria bacterium UBA8156]
MDEVQDLQIQVASLLLYQSVFAEGAGQLFLALLTAIRFSARDYRHCLTTYGLWFRAIAAHGQTWEAYLLDRILMDENPFSQQCQTQDLDALPAALVMAARHDLGILQNIYRCTSARLSAWVRQATHCPVASVPTLPVVRPPLTPDTDWAAALPSLVSHYRRCGTGLMARYRALRWHQDQWVGISHPDPVDFADLVGCADQEQALRANIEALLAGYPAQNVLLYGSRGSGKSSLVKALVQAYGERGLRLLEVPHADWHHLPAMVADLAERAQKFVLFADDLSFEEDDNDFKSFKVLLEGTLAAKPRNAILCATSNRRHLVRELWGDRPRPQDQEDLRSWDTLQQKLSFADRFGLVLTFPSITAATYGEIVAQLARQRNLRLTSEELRLQAEQWALRYNGRSGRTARQFVDALWVTEQQTVGE